MIGASTTMEIKRAPQGRAGWMYAPDARSQRDLNEAVAIIDGLTEVLIESWESIDAVTARAALDSIRRHTAVLKETLHRS